LLNVGGLLAALISIKLGGDTVLFKTTELLKRWRSCH
jgi:hypothetical protein